MTPSASPPAMTQATPLPVAMAADASLLAIPPRPRPDPARSASAMSSGAVPAGTSLMSSGPSGPGAYRPSRSVSSISRRARSNMATCAASTSLSPKVSSSVAVVSFSLITGTAPSAMRRSSVLRALRYDARCSRSADVSSTCPGTTPCEPNSAMYRANRTPCPTADAACRSGSASGRSAMPRVPSPQAMAPLDTSTGCRPRARSPAISPTRRCSTCSRRAPWSSTRVDDPILITMTSLMTAR